jgi:NAD(P)-dependent dehydrogenase (short-subunit alcohol dehydrogenase family)
MNMKESNTLQTIHKKVTLITGTSSGFGFLTAITLAKNGYQVIATMRDMGKQQKLLEEAERSGVKNKLHCMQLDVTNGEEIAQVTTAVMDTWGRIDLLVNNAGFAVGGYTEDIPIEEWRRQMETNFFGLVAMTKSVLPIMRTQGEGTIINISSVSGRMGFPGYAPYAASKFAVEGFSEALRLEMLPYGVKVVLVEPGAYQTDIWQKGFDQICAPASSSYRDRLQAVLRYSQQTAKSAPHPQEVADLIVRIAGLERPKLRYPIGKGSSLLLISKAILPWKSLEKKLTTLLSK